MIVEEVIIQEPDGRTRPFVSAIPLPEFLRAPDAASFGSFLASAFALYHRTEERDPKGRMIYKRD